MTSSRCARFLFAMLLVGTTGMDGAAVAAVPSSIRSFEVGSVQRTRSADAQGRIQLSVRTAERSFDLDLEPSPILAPGARTVFVNGSGEHASDSATSVYRGHLADDPDADVRVAIAGSTLVGSVRQGDQTWYFEPLRSYDPAAAANQALVYRASDIEASATSLGDCGVLDATTSSLSGLAAPASPSTTMRAIEGTRHRIVELTVVADYQFFQSRGADSAAYMLSVIDRIAEFYLIELGVILQVAQTVVYDSYGVEPFVDFTSAQSLLLSVGAARRDYPSTLGQGDLTHLFTGRDLDGLILGIAYRGGVCGTTQGVGLSQLFSTQLHDMVLLVGHELGHSLGAYHDGQAGTPCADEGFGSIMWTPFESRLSVAFSSCSESTIAPVLEAAACLELTPCGDGDLDPGEECDDGGNDNNDCCSSLCLFDPVGRDCTSDGNDCTEDYCDGVGSCYAPQGDGGRCNDWQACTLYGMCSAGTCVPDGTLRPLTKGAVRVRLGDQPEDHRMQIKGIFLGDGLWSSPTTGGVSVRLLDTDGSVLHDSTIAASSWLVDDSARRFSYVADDEPAPEAAGATAMSVTFRNPDNKPLKFRAKADFRGVDLNGLAGRGVIGLEITVGNPVEGICATATSLACKVSSNRLACK